MLKLLKLSGLLFLISIHSCDKVNKKIVLMNEVTNLKNDSLVQLFDETINPYVDSGFVGGVLVADSKRVILNKVYGKNTSTLNSNTSFWIASNTKPITAIAILKLHEDGIISIKDTITKFFKNVPLDKRNITIEQLLTHTSGLPSDFICEGEQNMELAIEKILSQKLISQSGKEFNYTNDGYIILAAIIQLTSKIKYESYIRKAIFEKSGMTSSNFWGEDNNSVDAISDSAKYKPFYPKIFEGGNPKENWNNKGASGISSTSSDLYKMLVALKEKKLLNQKSLNDLFIPRVEVDNTNDTILSYAYGWAILQYRKHPIETRHRGRGDYMHNNSIYLLPNGYIVIAWSKDTGPNSENWSTVICKDLIKKLN